MRWGNPYLGVAGCEKPALRGIRQSSDGAGAVWIPLPKPSGSPTLLL